MKNLHAVQPPAPVPDEFIGYVVSIENAWGRKIKVERRDTEFWYWSPTKQTMRHFDELLLTKYAESSRRYVRRYPALAQDVRDRLDA
jgi:hypothetical protein